MAKTSSNVKKEKQYEALKDQGRRRATTWASAMSARPARNRQGRP